MDYSYDNNKSVYSITPKDDIKDRIEVEIGDSKEPEIILPQAKFQRWDNEVNVSVRLKDFNEYSVMTGDDKIIFGNETKELHFYELTEGEGGYEIELVLNEKPASNKIEFTIQTKELDFFYQPKLTTEEVAIEGKWRPDNVVGSYAVYHKSKSGNYVGGKEYKAGKAFHIYRPHVTDSAGNETWAELNIDETSETLTINIDQAWLNGAIYPVIVDPTFGYTTAGSSSVAYTHDTAYYSIFAAPEDGSVTDITCYYRTNTTTGRAFGIYLSSSNAKLQTTASNTSTVDPANWQTLSLSSSQSITSSTNYKLVHYLDDGGKNAYILYYDTGDTNQGGHDTGLTYPTWPDPLSPDVQNTNKYSFYATYTASGGGTVVKDIIGPGIIPFAR